MGRDIGDTYTGDEWFDRRPRTCVMLEQVRSKESLADRLVEVTVDGTRANGVVVVEAAILTTTKLRVRV